MRFTGVRSAVCGVVCPNAQILQISDFEKKSLAVAAAASPHATTCRSFSEFNVSVKMKLLQALRDAFDDDATAGDEEEDAIYAKSKKNSAESQHEEVLSSAFQRCITSCLATPAPLPATAIATEIMEMLPTPRMSEDEVKEREKGPSFSFSLPMLSARPLQLAPPSLVSLGAIGRPTTDGARSPRDAMRVVQNAQSSWQIQTPARAIAVGGTTLRNGDVVPPPPPSTPPPPRATPPAPPPPSAPPRTMELPILFPSLSTRQGEPKGSPAAPPPPLPAHQLMRGGAASQQPAPTAAKLTASHFGFSHPGGSKPVGAKNQDTLFHLKIDEHNHAFGVFDGHGSDNGTLAAQTASDTIETYLATHFDQLRVDPEATFTAAFKAAHEAVRNAILRVDEGFRLVDGVVVEEWEDEDGVLRRDAVDGGTTATVMVLLDGVTLLHAQVGDSTALIGGSVRQTGDKVDFAFVEAMPEHSATNAAEYARVRSSGLRGELVRFVYDVPELVYDGEAPPIFRRRLGAGPTGGWELDPASQQQTLNLDTPPKNVRGDLPTILLSPSSDTAYPGLELPLTLAMTRAIGDFYMHTFGVTWQPEVKIWDLSSLLRNGLPLADGAQGTAFALEHITLVLASDGLWDLYANEDVFEAIIRHAGNVEQATAVAKAFFAASVQRGAEIFGSTADNMTGIVVYLHPPSEPGPHECAVDERLQGTAAAIHQPNDASSALLQSSSAVFEDDEFGA